VSTRKPIRESRNEIGPPTDATGRSQGDAALAMFPRSYAVVWREGEGPVRAGELVLGPTSLRLETGAPRERLSAQSLRYEELASVATAPPAQRIRGRPTAVVERHGRDRLAIAAVDGLGAAHEIVERLARLLPRRAKP